MKMGLGFFLGATACVLSACGGTPSAAGEEQRGSEIQLNLSTLGASGTEYRLGPATFDIISDRISDPTVTVAADGAEPALHVPLEKGFYRVQLRPEWTLSRVEGGTSTPVPATLLSSDVQEAYVQPFKTTPVNYAFHLGESGVDIGITVDEGN